MPFTTAMNHFQKNALDVSINEIVYILDILGEWGNKELLLDLT